MRKVISVTTFGVRTQLFSGKFDPAQATRGNGENLRPPGGCRPPLQSFTATQASDGRLRESGRDWSRSRVIRNSENVRPRVVRSGSRQLRQSLPTLASVLWVAWGFLQRGRRCENSYRSPSDSEKSCPVGSFPVGKGSRSGVRFRPTRHERKFRRIVAHTLNLGIRHARRIFAGPKSIPCDLSPQVLQ
jgi:hypothetical protein